MSGVRVRFAPSPTGRPWASTTVGLMLERGRLPGAGRLGSGTPGTSGAGLKSVSSLLSRNPCPGTTIPEPPVCSMVSVYSTTLPHRSAVVRCVVVDSMSPEGTAASASQ